MNPTQSQSEELSIASLADRWQELSRQMRYLALRGTPVHPEDAKRFEALTARGSEAIRAIASGESNATLGLQTQCAERALAARMLESGCPATDAAHPADAVERAPSRNHVRIVSGGDAVLQAQDIVLLFSARKQFGALKLRTERETFTLEYERGQVAHMHTSNAAEGERLGDLLVRLGALSTLQVENIRQRNQRGRIGEVLLALNYVSEAQLLAALEMQIHLLVGRLCHARVEQFAFWRGPLVFAKPHLRIDPEQMMLVPFFE